MITTSSDYLWFWWDSKKWIAYSPEQSNIIEKHYTHNYNACVITCNGNRYLIHFEKLLQVNVKTQRVRRIIRAKQSNQTKTFFGFCTVCFQERELFSTDNCKHQPDICQTCTMEYLLSRMNDKVSSISCINMDCKEEYSNEDISRYLNSHQKKIGSSFQQEIISINKKIIFAIAPIQNVKRLLKSIQKIVFFDVWNVTQKPVYDTVLFSMMGCRVMIMIDRQY